MCRFFARCLPSHNSVSFIPLKYVKFNLSCKYLQLGMNVKRDVIYIRFYVCSIAVIHVMLILNSYVESEALVGFTHNLFW